MLDNALNRVSRKSQYKNKFNILGLITQNINLIRPAFILHTQEIYHLDRYRHNLNKININFVLSPILIRTIVLIIVNISSCNLLAKNLVILHRKNHLFGI